jgi:iron complex transport system permease protein
MPASRLRFRWLAAGLAVALVALLAGLALGAVPLNPLRVAADLLSHLPGVNLHSGLSEQEDAIIWQLRLPRVVLGLLVGAMLALAGGAYQGVFRNPLADPYLLGVAAGAGLGATTAFGGALLAVGATYLLGAAGTVSRRGRLAAARGPATLLLAGVAVAAFCTAVQTYLQQRNVYDVQEVYSWLLGRLTTSGWHEVLILLPYAAVTGAVIVSRGRALDVMSVGDEEAASLGLHPGRTRLLLVVTATLGTAAAVSVSGLIGFVGIIVPHTVRLLAGSSYRVILPLSMLYGGAFLTLADLLARTVMAPSELPIGVVTAFFGAPFFVVVLRAARSVPV